eukprot:COSAG01_NODE_952_length_12499_cov_84.157661_12_plen_126_part_00
MGGWASLHHCTAAATGPAAMVPLEAARARPRPRVQKSERSLFPLGQPTTNLESGEIAVIIPLRQSQRHVIDLLQYSCTRSWLPYGQIYYDCTAVVCLLSVCTMYDWLCTTTAIQSQASRGQAKGV